MLDALDPFVKTLLQGVGWKVKATRAVLLPRSQRRSAAPKPPPQMKPALGRSSYLGDRVLGYPDPGAKAVTVWLRAACEALFARQDRPLCRLWNGESGLLL
jgi:dihydroxyacetone kinase